MYSLWSENPSLHTNIAIECIKNIHQNLPMISGVLNLGPILSVLGIIGLPTIDMPFHCALHLINKRLKSHKEDTNAIPKEVWVPLQVAGMCLETSEKENFIKVNESTYWIYICAVCLRVVDISGTRSLIYASFAMKTIIIEIYIRQRGSLLFHLFHRIVNNYTLQFVPDGPDIDEIILPNTMSNGHTRI